MQKLEVIHIVENSCITVALVLEALRFMEITQRLKRIGPRREPWGTPLTTVAR